MSARNDLASDFSRFHGIRNAGILPSRVFLRLASRLEHYGGAMTARQLAASAHAAAPGASRTPRPVPRHPTGPEPRYTPHTAEAAPPATAASLTALNAQLGQVWFTHRTVPDGSGNG
jgi:hypothetical protein